MASEILSYSLTAGVTNAESVLINGVDGLTYTIISIICTETAAAAETLDIYIDENGGGTDYEILSDQAIGANETIVWNDRFVITDTDHLCAAAASSANIDIVVSFLDQTR